MESDERKGIPMRNEIHLKANPWLLILVLLFMNGCRFSTEGKNAGSGSDLAIERNGASGRSPATPPPATAVSRVAYGSTIPVAGNRALGYNRFNLFQQYLGRTSGQEGNPGATPQLKAMGRKSIWDAKNHGAAYVRVSMTGWGPHVPDIGRGDLELWMSDNTAYWALVDEMMNDLEAAGLKIVPVFLWNAPQFPSVAGGSMRDLVGDPNSAAYKLLERYTREFTTRYKDRGLVEFYELTNELNLFVDLDLPTLCRQNGTTNPDRDCRTWVRFTTAQMNAFAARLAGVIRSIHPGAQISSGYGSPRPNAYRLSRGLAGNDTREEYATILRETHQSLDIVSIHFYDGTSNTDLSRWGGTSLRDFLAWTNQKTVEAGKKLYIGEFIYQVGDGFYGPRIDFFGNVMNAVVDFNIAYASPWILEFYQSDTVRTDSVSLDPGLNDAELSLMRQTAARLGSFKAPTGADKVPPQVVITFPFDQQKLTVDQPVHVVASDDRHTINRVEVTIGNQKRVLTQAPYSFNLRTADLAKGLQTLKATVYDAAGNSSSHQITVNADPSNYVYQQIKLTSAGGGCDDLRCVWINGNNLTYKTRATVRRLDWSVMNEYTAAEMTMGTLGSVNFRLKTDAEIAEARSKGIRVTLSDDYTWDTIEIPASKILVSGAGMGGDDGRSIWVTGSNFSSTARVEIRNRSWQVLHTYAPGEYDRKSMENLTLRLATDAEIRESYGAGLIVTVGDGATWDSREIAPNRAADVTEAGYGCDDGNCLWINGAGFQKDMTVTVRNKDWTVLRTYAPGQYDFKGATNMTLRLATQSEINESRGRGLVITVGNSYTWDSIDVRPR